MTKPDGLRVQMQNIRNAMDSVLAYQQHYLSTIKRVPSGDDLRQTHERLRKEAGKSFTSDDIGAILACERIAAVAYVGLLELLEEALLQAVNEAGK